MQFPIALEQRANTVQFSPLVLKRPIKFVFVFSKSLYNAFSFFLSLLYLKKMHSVTHCHNCAQKPYVDFFWLFWVIVEFFSPFSRVWKIFLRLRFISTLRCLKIKFWYENITPQRYHQIITGKFARSVYLLSIHWKCNNFAKNRYFGKNKQSWMELGNRYLNNYQNFNCEIEIQAAHPTFCALCITNLFDLRIFFARATSLDFAMIVYKCCTEGISNPQ